MIDRGCGAWRKACVLPAALMGAALTIGGQPAALPLSDGLAPATPLVLVENGPRAAPADEAERAGARDGGADRPNAPLAELTETLAAARAKLEQLDRAAEVLAGAAALRAELTAKQAELAEKAEENRRLVAELQSLRSERAAWQRADDAAKAEIAGLGAALDEAMAEAKKLDAELAAVRWQNAQLSTSLSRARSEHDAARAEAEAVREEFTARVDTLVADAESSVAEIERLSDELAERGEDLAAADRAREQAAARVAELQQAVDDADDERGRLRSQLGATRARLNEVNAALSAAEQERDTALAALDEERAKSDRLRGALTVADADLAQARAANGDLETRLAGLEEAAMMATDAARENLLAVENQIAALNSTLAEVKPAPSAGAAAGADGAQQKAVIDAPRTPGESRREVDGESAALAALAAAGPSGPADGEIALIKRSEPAAPASRRSLAELTAEFPIEGRIQAQSLLADLEAETDRQGVKLMVPGGELFTVNGEVRDTAHESLAKVAELINLYKSQPVLIVGHTDAIGAPDYNQTLSERRAALVRQFFIDHFDVEAARLSTQGMGEQKPIASNATAAGRRANRRVEVLILN